MTGGLGNQMFQYAYLLSLRSKGVNITIDTSLYNYTKMHNGFELDKVFSINEYPHSKGKGRDRMRILLLRLILRIRPHFLLTEEIFDSISINQELKCFIKGEFQSELYFKDIEDSIRAVYLFKSIDSANKKMAEKIRSVNSVSVHLRRGDYLNNPLYEGICTKTYYIRAISEILSRQPDCVFFVFSNDISWSRSFFQEYFNNVSYYIVELNSGEKSYQDMFLMSQCRHNIIANSSFS